jgi:xylonate dehydratase
VITDARFSGVSTGACIGHIGPEALAGGPIGRLRDGDLIEIVIDRRTLTGSVNLVGTRTRFCRMTPDCGRRCKQPAAARGPAASTIPSGSSKCCRPGCRR